MGKIIKPTLVLYLAVMFSACSDSFLDKQPYNKLSEASFWKDLNDAEAGLTSVYDVLQVSNTSMGWSAMAYFDMITPIGYNRPANSAKFREIARGDHDGRNGAVNALWTNSYRGIVRANDFLTHIDDIEAISENDQSRKQRYTAEARYLRGMFYFHLVDLYGGVPLFESVPKIEDQLAVRSSREEVMAFVIADFDYAIANLPAVPTEIGRATEGAARTMRAKVAMLEKDWQTAIEQTTAVMGLGYTLQDNYADIFKLENENNSEVIFDIQYVSQNDAEPGAKFQKAFSNASSQANGFSWIQPTRWLLDKYEVIDPEPEYIIEDNRISKEVYDYFEGKDPRLDANFLRPGAYFTDRENNDVLYPYQMQKYTLAATGMNMRKYVIEGKNETASSNDSPLNWIILRYADVLLMRAEAEAEQRGGAANVPQDILDATINVVRYRASDLLPKYMAGSLTMEQIQDEYMRELPFEGWMYFNFRRWRLMHLNDGYQPKGLKITKKSVKLSGAPVLETRAFDESKHYIFPIPEQERDLAPNLEQNPEWE
ncbi:membrane protein (plasmid) [Fulvitalea axinellae]|uniref:Membrane protein n=1 Tax=Fulvitalea axinellae TaxID=1182444 RepID=A0AAU9CQQ4_9BACT|nr:membrane protein [Fulvitalea axinellae]